MYYLTEQEKQKEIINGSSVVKMFSDGSVMTKDGRFYYLNDTSYCDADTGWEWVNESEWVEFEPHSEYYLSPV